MCDPMHGMVGRVTSAMVVVVSAATVACGPQIELYGEDGSGAGDAATEAEAEAETEIDSADGTTGDPHQTTASADGVDGDCQWVVQTVVPSTALPEPFWGQVSAGPDGMVLSRGGLQVDPLLSYDFSGALRWSRQIEDPESIRDLFSLDDGTTLVIGDVTGGAGVWLGLLEDSGEVRWSTSFADGGGLWAVGYVLPASQGEIFVGYENELETAVSRRDAAGNELWTASLPRPEGVTGQHHALAAMPDGDVLQLRRAGISLLMHRSGEDGSILAESSSNLRIEDVVVLPDGTVFMVGSDDVDTTFLQEIMIGGDLVASQSFEDELYLRLAWDPGTERLYVGGKAREPGEYAKAFRKIVDRNGVERFSLVDPPDTGSEVVDVAPLPDGGFVEIRRGGLDVLSITCQ